MTKCLILSHGELAQAYLDASKQILGECEGLYAINCATLTPKALYDEIVQLVEAESLQDGFYILVSLKGGSCWNVAAKIVMAYQKVELISGLNLSMVLSFITKRNQYSFRELAEVLLRDGARGIARLDSKQ